MPSTASDPPTCHIDGFGPMPVVRPDSVAQVGDIVRYAAADGAAVYSVGGGTRLGLGNPPAKAGRAMDLRGLDRVIEFAARDMTVTVEAGITIAKLQSLLAAERLRLPVDVPRGVEATLGGAIATNTSGPRRFGYGTLRDYVIGIAAVNDEGSEFKAGGRVVKNVAGYDLCKLLVGSLGTLGVITRATLKLVPLAEEDALIALACDADALGGVLDRVHGSRTRPVCVEVLSRPAAEVVFARAGQPVPDAAWTVVVGYEGNADAVEWQVQQLVKELGVGHPLEAFVGATTQPLWHALVAWGQWPAAVATFKANLLPNGVAEFCRRFGADAHLRAHAGNGIVVGHLTDALTKPRAAELLAEWRRANAGGAVVVTQCPPGWKDVLDVWGPPRGDAWLMRAVKEKFDPRRVFNPGRFVDGI
jgi:glycolate oxidase FAD binding subunit